MQLAGRVIVFCLFGAGVQACAGDGTGLDDGLGRTPTFAADVQPIFTANCTFSGCHSGTSPQQGQNLTAGQAWFNIVNVPSKESGLLRVKPGAPDESYLVHKIQGTQTTVGGSGSRMPLQGCCLSPGQIGTIRAWIAAGALNN